MKMNLTYRLLQHMLLLTYTLHLLNDVYACMDCLIWTAFVLLEARLYK